MKKFNKVTTGFVIQEYITLDNGTLVCVGQTFHAGDADYENEMGENILDQIDTTKEVYCPFDMVQPKKIPSTKGLKFICPSCDGTELECVMDGGYSSLVTVIHEDGQFEYDNEAIECELGHYQCNHCGKRLMDDDDYEIQDDEQIVEWIKRECPQD